MEGVLHHCGGVDDLAAHFLGSLVHGGQTGAVRIGAVNDTGIHAGLADLGGDFLDVGTVGDDTGSSQSCLIQIIVSQDLLGVLTHGHITVAHAEQDILCLQVLSQAVEAVNPLVAALGYTEHDLVLQQIHTAFGIHKVQALGVSLSGSGAVQLVHLLLTGGEEQVAVRTLLDLGLEGSGRVKVEAEGHAGVLCGVGLGNGVQGLGQGGGSKNDQLHALAGGSLRGGGSGGCGGRCSAAGGAAAGGQNSRCGCDAGSAQEAAAGDHSFHSLAPYSGYAFVVLLFLRPAPKAAPRR